MENRKIKIKEGKAMHIRLVSGQNRIALAQETDPVKAELMTAIIQSAITIAPLVSQLTADKNQCDCP